MTTSPDSIKSEISTTMSAYGEETTHSDGNMIRRLQAGDLTSLGELYDRYKNKTYQTALALTHDPAAADDILQDCFLRLHRYAHSIDPSRPLIPWLYRVTVNLSYTWASRRKRWFIPLHLIQDRFTHPQQHPEIQAENIEFQDDIIHALASMNIQHRTVIVLYYLNSLSTEEIAQTLDCPVGTVKSRLFYGREKLRAELSKTWIKPKEMKYKFA